jgi:hypothetical protein
MRSLTKNMQASLMNLLPRFSSSVPCPGRGKWVLTAASSSSFHLLPFHRCDASPSCSSCSCSCSSSPAASFYLWTKTNQRSQGLKLLELKIHNSGAINIRRNKKKKLVAIRSKIPRIELPAGITCTKKQLPFLSSSQSS